MATPAIPNVATPVHLAGKFQSYDTPQHVTITLKARGADAEGSTIQVVQDGTVLQARILLASGDSWDLDLPLYAAVEPDAEYIRIIWKSVNVEVRLTKQIVAAWPSCTPAPGSSAVVAPAPAPVAAPAVAVAPASAAASAGTVEAETGKLPAFHGGDKNWDALDDSDDEDASKLGGDAGLQKLFQQIYANADPDTRRAMIKSYQTSGGTVLSTNWSEVGTTDYESSIKPPDGMEVRKREY